MRFHNLPAITFDDVLLVPQHTDLSRSDPVLETRFTRKIKIKSPLVSANMDTITESAMAIEMHRLGGVGILHRFMSPEKMANEIIECHNHSVCPICVSVGVAGDWKENIDRILGMKKVQVIVIDVAHGDQEKVLIVLDYLKKYYAHIQVICGNVATADAVHRLSERGADAIKCGVGAGCFGPGTRILMSNGVYKNIEDIKSGDRVINKYGDPVNVVSAQKTGHKQISKIRTNIWYDYTYVTGDHRYWIGDLSSSSLKTLQSVGYKKLLSKKSKTIPKKSKYKWLPISDFVRGCLLMPRHIKFEMQNDFEIKLEKRCGGNKKHNIKYEVDSIIKPCYDTGYIFGTFLGDGTSSVVCYKKSCRGSVRWTFGLNEDDIANKLKNCIQRVLCKELSIKKESNDILCSLYYKPLSDFFTRFGKKSNKSLPEEYFVHNIEYLRGIIDGLIDSDGWQEEKRNSLSNTSTKIIELFGVCYYLVYGYFPNNQRRDPTAGGLKYCNVENCMPSYISRTLSKPEDRLTDENQIVKLLEHEKKSLYIDVYDIEVDCPSHSFIANNAIVHNSLCSTRVRTGCGVAQLSCIIDCVEAAKQYDVPIISDGGHRISADIVKSLAAGAETTMCGSLFSGHKECPGDLRIIKGQKYKEYRGSASLAAMSDWRGEVPKHIVPEGEMKIVPYKGEVEQIVYELLGGLRSAMTYNNARTIKELHANAIFRLVSNNTRVENMPHGLLEG